MADDPNSLKWWLKTSLKVVGGIFAFLLLAYAIQIAWYSLPKEQVLLPQGYEGYVVVFFGVADGVEGDGLWEWAYEIPPSGVLCVRGQKDYQIVWHSTYKYRDGQRLDYRGDERMIWSDRYGRMNRGDDIQFMDFYVGKKVPSDYRRPELAPLFEKHCQ